MIGSFTLQIILWIGSVCTYSLPVTEMKNETRNRLSSKAATPLFRCSFESCLEQSTQDDADWDRNSGRTSTNYTGPTAAYVGDYYMYYESSYGLSGFTAMLQTSRLEYSGYVCIHFAYHMYGANMGGLDVSIYGSSGDRPTGFSVAGDQGNVWNVANLEVYMNLNERVRWRATRGYSAYSDIAIDDVIITDGICPISACDFERSICLVQSSSYQSNWVRHTGATGNPDTGPSGAYQGKYYLYFEALYTTPGDQAVVNIGSLGYDGQVCIFFAYHMYGADVGTLELSLSGSSSPLWSISGNRGDKWLTYRLTTLVTTSTQVRWTATRGLGARGDIAIDNIVISKGATCTQILYHCDNEDCLEQYQYGQGNWTQRSKSTPTPSTGPSAAFQGDSYMYYEATGQSLGDQAIVQTAPLNYDGPACVDFAYHMYGSGMGMLRLRISGRSGMSATPFSVAGDQGNKWHQAAVTVQLTPSDKVLWAATCGSSWASDIAIDDVTIMPGECSLGNAGAVPPALHVLALLVLGSAVRCWAAS